MCLCTDGKSGNEREGIFRRADDARGPQELGRERHVELADLLGGLRGVRGAAAGGLGLRQKAQRPTLGGGAPAGGAAAAPRAGGGAP